MKKEIGDVHEFHMRMGVPVMMHPGIPDRSRCRLRQDLMAEEMKELMHAIDERNLTEIADGLADVLYVVYGTALEFGMGDILPAIFAEVHRSNMSKINPDGTVTKREDGKVIKPDTYSPADIARILCSDNTENTGTIECAKVNQ